jgi:hypothetical protein
MAVAMAVTSSNETVTVMKTVAMCINNQVTVTMATVAGQQ